MAWALVAAGALLAIGPGAAGGQDRREPVVVRVPVSAAREVDVADVVARVAERTGAHVERPAGSLRLPVGGLAGALTQELLQGGLGPSVKIALEPRELVLTVPGELLEPEALPAMEARLRALASRAQAEAHRREARYGMHARPSYRPNDPARPTVCLVHGLNSSSEVFVHMFGPLEEAGLGVVVYDFPYNRDLDESARAFARDWAEFRARSGDKQPWAIVSHSMGALLARWYVEASPAYANDVSRLVMIAPPNQGSNLAHAQTLLQLIQGLKAVKGQQARALAAVSDGLGAAAGDMQPASAFLKALNQHARRAGVCYYVLAGDSGVLSVSARRQVELQLAGLGSGRGLLGNLARMAAGDVRSRLDEMTEGLGDGCVSVSATRLEGACEHCTIHANHLELIRAPLLYPDPGPVASMPYVLRWLGK